MDFQGILKKIGEGFKKFWHWLKPYLSRFHQARKRIWKKYHINKIIILLSLVAVLVTSIYLYTVAKSVDVADLESNLRASTVVYDKDGEEAGSLTGTFGQKGTYTDLANISTYIQQAVIATEDKTFYSHNGFSIKGILRAAFNSLRSGSIAGGGSTITQQLAKNAFLTQDQTLTRKAKELFMAIEIEKKYSKDQILEMYLNNGYFGNGVWGVEDAAQKYFGVSASEVTISEAAMLAGMLKGPSIYNPIDNPENANNRKSTVLSLMLEDAVITQEQYDAENSVDITTLLYDNYEAKDDYSYPYYFDAVINEITNEYGIDEEDLLQDGYQIYTALDQNQQTAMQTVFENDYLFPDAAADGQIVQSGSVAVDPNTGGVTALVGGRGDYTLRGFNYATQTQRAPGSTLKPISVYTAALEAGYTPSSILQDTALDYYDVKNYDGTYSGEVPMYQAVAQSLNSPAVWLLNEIGVDVGYAETQKFGIPLAESDAYYGLALGGLEKGVSPQQMAEAYAVFANGGTLYDTHLVTRIVDSSGAVIVDNTDQSGSKVTSSDVTDAMTSMLLGVFSNGTGSRANPSGYTLAGKTGTQEASFSDTANSDQWIVGYTPNIVVATWIGFPTTDESHYLEGSSSTGVAPVFKAQTEAILPYVESASFDVVDAYLTDGQVVSTEDYNDTSDSSDSSSDSSSSWSDSLSGVGDSLKEIGGQIKDGFDNLVGGASDWWNSITGD
ncbi:PBP1A family penicillin-binding protein [Enterococcus sp. LJL120]